MAPSSTEHNGRIARVVPLLRLHHLGDRQFDYLITESLTDAVVRGSIVTVPFGKRTVRAVVLETGLQADVADEGLRAIEGVAADGVSDELVDLAQALAKRYLCSLESCLRLVAPVGSASGRTTRTAVRKDHVVPAPDPDPEVVAKLTAKQRAVLAAVPAGGIAKKALCELTGVVMGVLATLEGKGLIDSCEASADATRSGSEARGIEIGRAHV